MIAAAREFLLAPATARRPQPPERRDFRAAALGHDAAATACALALTRGGGCVAAFGGPPVAAGVATRAAGSLARRLEARGFAAAARGRLTLVGLDGCAPDAVLMAERLDAAVEGVLVLALPDARAAAWESRLASQDLVIVSRSRGHGAIADLAVEQLAAEGIAALAAEPLATLARLLALMGLGVSPGARRFARGWA